MSHFIVNSCPLTKFDGGLLRPHEADEAADNIMTLTPSIQQQQLKIETRDFQLSIEISQQANHFSRYSVAVQDRA